MKQFLKSKFRVEYQPEEMTPLWKGFWYYNLSKNRIFVTIIPLNVIFAIVREFHYVFKACGIEADRFYRQQIKLRRKQSND